MHQLVWARAGKQLLVGGALLHHTSHSSLLVVKGASPGGRPVLAFGWGGKRRARPPSSPTPQRAEKQPVEMVCPPRALTFASHCWCQALPSFPMLCSKGRSEFCQGLEAYQKCIRRNTASGKWSGAPTRKDLLCSFLPAGLE